VLRVLEPAWTVASSGDDAGARQCRHVVRCWLPAGGNRIRTIGPAV